MKSRITPNALKDILVRRKWIFIGCAAAILAGTSVFLSFYFNPDARRARAALAFEERRYRQHTGRGGGEPGPENRKEGDLEGMVEMSEQLTPEVLMAEYQLIYRYPLSSRPLTPLMDDLIDPWTVHPVKQAIYENDPPLENEKPSYFYTWSAPTSMITGSRPAVAKLTLYESNADSPVAVEVTSAGMVSDPVFGNLRVGDARYAGDDTGAYTFTWTPEKGNRLHWGNLRLVVEFRAPNGRNYQVEALFRSTPDPPAVFTGDMRERLDNGSLVVEVEMNVMKEGQYILEANLFDEEGHPLHWAYLNKYLERGSQEVDFPFFGLVFHDRKFGGGRLVMRNLRGHRLNLGYDPRRLDEMLKNGQEVPTTNAPEIEWIEPYDQDFVTARSYDIDEFSTAEYEGRDKADRLDAIRQYTKTWEEAHGPAQESSD